MTKGVEGALTSIVCLLGKSHGAAELSSVGRHFPISESGISHPTTIFLNHKPKKKIRLNLRPFT